jgi:hypothetical protein
MAISFVNGFLCTSSCDVSKAKNGEDPHPSTSTNKVDASKTDATSSVSRDDQPAVLFGGSLSGPSTPDGVKAIESTSSADPTTWWKQGFTVDRLA